ncbi:YcxB family protein [Ruminococcaceae bacterium OttesenSCG-928-I18]|nr:YcxB family protein [Ruminococcaceae bacterium OttesenSCG-928-I18]
MLCRVEMPLSEQIYGRFYRYKIMHGSTGGRASLILLPFIVLIFCFVTFLTGTGFFMPIALVVMVIIYCYYTLFVKPNSLFRAKPGAALRTEVTIFTDSGLNRSITSEEGGVPETESMQYSALHSAAETSRDFYLFTSPTQAYLIDKQYFTKGSPEELRETLQKNLGPKFKSK